MWSQQNLSTTDVLEIVPERQDSDENVEADKSFHVLADDIKEEPFTVESDSDSGRFNDIDESLSEYYVNKLFDIFF